MIDRYLSPRATAYAVHCYTASGLVWALFALLAIFANDYRAAFFWMLVAVSVDATDGFLARKYRVKVVLPEVDGRKMDDIVDYLNYTFLPIVLLIHAGWLPDPQWLWGAIPLIASIFGFCFGTAKEEKAGFFGGFPSYWNIVVFYIAIWIHHTGPTFVVSLLIFLSVLSFMPVRFVYPNLAPRWKGFFLYGAWLWGLMLLGMLVAYPDIPFWIVYASLFYPIAYTILSIYLDLEDRKSKG